jgi:dodecin
MDPVYKKLEGVGTSPKSFAEAVAHGVAQAAKTQSGMSWFEVVEMRGSIVDGKVHQYQVTIRIGARLE